MRLATPIRIAALACLLAGADARALERVTLRNGFSYDCASRQPLDDNRVRLYLTADAANYIDLPAAAIATVEPLPEPPRPAPVAPTAPAAQTVSDLIARAGAQHNIDVELLASIVKAESGGRSNAVSRTGARGLMQLMPATAHELGVEDAFRPDQNIAGGSAYLDALLNRYDPRGDKHGLDLALAAYNAGPAAIDRYRGIPPFRETRAYVARVEREFARRKAAAAHNAPALAAR